MAIPDWGDNNNQMQHSTLLLAYMLQSVKQSLADTSARSQEDKWL